MLVTFRIFCRVNSQWNELYKKFMIMVIGSRWFNEKYGDVIKDEKTVTGSPNSSVDQKGNDVVSDANIPSVERGSIKTERISIKVEDVKSLKDIIREVIKESIKEVIKDLVVKEVKKKKEKVVTGDTVTPKKKSKKSVVVGEVGTSVVETVPSKKKKVSKRKELVIKEELPKG
jgi:hypothetical protein